MTRRLSATEICGAAIALLALGACVSERSSRELGPRASARAFVAERYAIYDAPFLHAPPETPWSELFAKDTFALIEKGNRVAEGELPPLAEFDIFCHCQDWQGLSAKIKVMSASLSTAKVRARVRPYRWEPEAHVVDYDLVREDGAWRIHDLHEEGLASLRARMAAEIESAATR